MSGGAVTEADFRSGVTEMFKALDLDQNNVLDWSECKYLVTQVMKQDGGYDSQSFKAKYDLMDKNEDGKISKNELMEAVIEVGRERNLFGPNSRKVVAPQRATIDLEQVARNPAQYDLVLTGHNDHPDCNGTYEYAGDENGKPKWAKGDKKLNWTGRCWDIHWGGFSPEAHVDTPVPPLTGYD